MELLKSKKTFEREKEEILGSSFFLHSSYQLEHLGRYLADLEIDLDFLEEQFASLLHAVALLDLPLDVLALNFEPSLFFIQGIPFRIIPA